MYVLLHLHMLASYNWFNCEQVLAILDKFPPDVITARVDVVVSLFGRIVDLENMDKILNALPNSVRGVVRCASDFVLLILL